MLLVQGDGAELKLRKEFGEGEGSLREELRNDSEPGCVVVCGHSQMLPLAKRYFYQSLNKVIRENETKHAKKVIAIFSVEAAEIALSALAEVELERVTRIETQLSEEQVTSLLEGE